MVVFKPKLLTLAVLGFIFINHAITVSCTRSRMGADQTGRVSKSLLHQGLKRDYHLYIPASYRHTAATPLVIALHGGGGTGPKMEKLSRLSLLADQYGFIVAYPEAVEHNWNDGRGLSKYRSQRENIDDVGFIASMMDAIAGDYDIDAKRVYVTGASNGAMMSLRLGCEMADKITAIAALIGSMPANLVSKCRPARPLPLLMINGTADPLVPYGGGYVHIFRKKLGKIISVPQTIEFWVARNGCSPRPEIRWEPDTDPEDGTRVQKIIYSQCTDDAEVVLYAIKGGGHTWPGGYQYLPEFLIGKTNRDMDAAKTIWNFFNGHRK
jgi:polyhydroxybutyrate depolymerase